MTSLSGISLHISWTPPIQRGGVDAVRYKITIKCFDSPFEIHQDTRYSDTNSYNLPLPNELDSEKDSTCYVVSVGIVRAPRYPDGLSANVCVHTKLRCESLSSQTVPCQ